MEKARKFGANMAKRVQGGVGSPLSSRMSMESSRSSVFESEWGGRTCPDVSVTINKTSVNDPLGMLIDPHTRTITTVEKGSLAEKHGIEVGFTVTAINNVPVFTLDDIKKAVGSAGTTIPMVFSDPRLHNDRSLMVIKEDTYNTLIQEHAAAREKEQNIAAQDAKSSKIHQQMKKTSAQAQSLCDSKIQDVRRAKDLISKSKAAQNLVALEEQLRTAEMRYEEDVANLKQAEAAIKVSIKKAEAENRSLKIKLDELPAEEAGDASAFLNASSADLMDLAIQLQQLQEKTEEERKELKEATTAADALNKDLEVLQAEVKEGDAKAKSLKRAIDDLTAENDALADEKKRLLSLKQQGDEEYSQTVKQLMEKLKAVGADKDKHLQQTSELMHKVQGGETSAMRRLRGLEMELEIKKKDNETLQATNASMRAEETALLKKLQEKEKKAELLKQARKRMTDAESEVSHITEATTKAKRGAQVLHEENKKLESKSKRISNLVKEKTESYKEELSLVEELKDEIEQQKKQLAVVEPLEAQVAKLEKDLADMQTELQHESQVAKSLVEDMMRLKEERACAEVELGEAEMKRMGLAAQARIAHETVEMRKGEIRQLTQQHEQELDDISRDIMIMKKKCVLKENDLQEQLTVTEQQANEMEVSLKKLLKRLGDPNDLDTPEEAPALVPQAFDADNAKYELSFLGLTEENIKLSDLVHEMQERTWAAEQLKRAIEEDVAKRSRETAKKDALVAKHFIANIDKDELQAVIESTMIDNMRLRDMNQKLSNELASRC